MLRGKTIIYFGPEPWDGLWRNRHQLMSRFAADNNVWYVEPPTLLRQLFSGRGHRTRLFSRDKCGVNIFHSPWWLPIIGRSPFKKLTLRLYLSLLAKLTGDQGGKPILWLSRPGMIDYAQGIDASLTIYHVVDEYSGYGSPNQKQREKLEAKETDLLGAVDMAIVVTPTLYALKVRHNPNTHLVANAADFAAYSESSAPLPDDMRNIPRPIIGYTGLIAARLNLALLIEAADAKPDWSFVFVGTIDDKQCQAEMHELERRENVHFLGQKPIEDTPSYVATFDVSIIPYAVNLRAQHASPLKLFEYAAASKPIVATDFAAARDFAGRIQIAHDTDEFVAHCENGLTISPSDPSIVENRKFASENTWDARVKQISELIISRGAL